MSESNGGGLPQNPAQAPELKTEQTQQTQDPKLDLYMKKEKELRQLQKRLQMEKQEMLKKASEYETGYIPKNRLKENPFEVLAEAGLDYNSLAEQLLAQPNMNDPATRALMNKIRALEEKQMQSERMQQESVKAQYDNAVKQITNDVKLLVSSNSEFETIKELGLEESVVELIRETFDTDGTLMDLESACKQVEEEALEQLVKASKLKKLQEKLSPKVEETKPPQQNQAIKTLTNLQSQNQPKKSSEKDRIARALAAFQGKLT